MRHLAIITVLLVTFAGCDSSVSSNKSPGGLLSSSQGGVNTLSSTTPNDPLFSQQDYLNTANVPQAWQTTNGSSSKEIAVIAMGGIDNDHEDLTSRVTIKRAAGSLVADNGAANPAAGIIGATTNNGKGIAGVNWNAPVLSYNIAKETTGQVDQLPSGIPITKTFVYLNESAVAPAINEAVNDGAKTIYLPLYWLLEDQVPELAISDFQFYPCCKVDNPYRQIYDNAVNIINSIAAAFKQNNNYTSAISAVRNAYESGTVVVGSALPYNGILPLGLPANLASDHVVLTVGAANETNDPFQFSGTPEGDDVSSNPRDINLIAPGVDLLSTLPDGNQYGNVSGTSASAALGTGIISLLQAAEVDLTPDDVAHILEKTAAPVGGPGYDNDSGFGLIDAGAAMDFVDTHDIKHATTTDGQVEQVDSGRQITLFSSVWKELASGTYFADVYEVTYTIPLVPSASNDLWFNAGETLGWSAANSNDQNRFANVELFNDHATVTTYIYDVSSSVLGQSIGWFPASPDNVQLSYSYVGEKPNPFPSPGGLNVTIVGGGSAYVGQQKNWTADVSQGSSPYSYSWQKKEEGQSNFYIVGTGSSYTETISGTEDFDLKVVVTDSQNDDTSDQIHVTVGDYIPIIQF